MNRLGAKLTTLTSDRWSQLVEEAKGASYFSTPEWALATAEQIGGRPTAWLLSIGQYEYLVSAVVKTGRSGLQHILAMPYGTYPGIIPLNGAPRDAALLVHGMHRAGALGFGTGEVQFNLGTGWDSAHALHVHETHCVDLHSGVTGVWAAMSQSARRAVRQAERRDVLVSEVRGEEAYRGLYQLIELSLPTWGLSRPPYPWDLFRRISQDDASSGRVLVPRLWRAAHEGDTLAYALVFYGRDEAFYWAGATNRAHSHYLGGVLLHWHILRHAAERQLRTYNMGSSEGLEGVRRFKEGFGAVPRTVFSGRYEGPLLRGVRCVQQLAGAIKKRVRLGMPPDRKD